MALNSFPNNRNLNWINLNAIADGKLNAALNMSSRVLPRYQIHWDKWPTEFEKDGPFKKIWGPS